MNIKSGFYYHIKDVFFDEVQDDALMSNKEDGNYRPHFLAIQDFQNSGISLFYTDIDRIYDLMKEKLMKTT